MRILEATRKLLLEKLGAGVTMADIAKETGISRQAVYLHFESRPDLLVAAVQYADDLLGLGERFMPVRSARNGVEHLELFIDFWGHYMGEIYGIAKALLASRENDDAASAAWKDRMDSVRGGCGDALMHLERDGSLSGGWSVDEATDLLWTILSIPGWEQLTIERGWSIDKYVEKMQRVARRSFVKAL